MQQNPFKEVSLEQYNFTSRKKKKVKQPNHTPKTTKEEQTRPKVSGKKVIIKLRAVNITHYQRNANQNHSEVPLYANQDGCYPKVYKQ